MERHKYDDSKVPENIKEYAKKLGYDRVVKLDFWSEPINSYKGYTEVYSATSQDNDYIYILFKKNKIRKATFRESEELMNIYN